MQPCVMKTVSMSMHCYYGEDFNRCNTLYCSVRTPKQKSRDTPLITLGVITKGNITPIIVFVWIMFNESQGKPKESQFAKMFNNVLYTKPMLVTSTLQGLTHLILQRS